MHSWVEIYISQLEFECDPPSLGFATLKVNPELMIQVATVNVDNRKAVNV